MRQRPSSTQRLLCRSLAVVVSASGMCSKPFDISRVLTHDLRSLKHSYSHTRDKIREKSKTASAATLPIFALTIGIDRYENPEIKNLHGCAADADNMVKFLTKTLHVPLDHISSLRNEEATAERFTAALETLATDPRIPMDANSILIFYAGHGSEARPPNGWSASGNIQTLLPYDFDPGSGDNPVAINGLADMKLSRLLENIANAKGNNITVILDSCHAGSGTRGFGGESVPKTRSARGVRLHQHTRLSPDALPASPDSVVVDSATGRYQSLDSHVLLAACNPVQQAYEKDRRGAFTTALIKLLNSADLERLSYTDVVLRLDAIPDQSPQCEGMNQRRVFLRNHVAEHHRVFKVKKDTTGVYTIDAGEEAEITHDAEFAVFDSPDLTNRLGRLVVDVVTEFGCKLRSADGQEPFDVPGAGVAILTRIGAPRDVRLLIESGNKMFTNLSTRTLKFLGFDPSFLKVIGKKEEHPDIIIVASGNQAQIKITDQLCCEVGLHEIPHRPSMDSETMERVLRGAANFYRKLHHTTNGRHLLAPKIWCECHELRYDGEHGTGMQPIGNDLLVDNMLHIEVGAQVSSKTYGFRINNISHVPLFVSVFYFSMSDLSIESCYEPPSAGVDSHFPPLPGEGFLTIGYGSGGYPSRTFGLKQGQNVDVGYLKLFLSTQHVDYSHMPQASSLCHDRATVVYKPKQRVWDTMLIPVILLREL